MERILFVAIIVFVTKKCCMPVFVVGGKLLEAVQSFIYSTDSRVYVSGQDWM